MAEWMDGWTRKRKRQGKEDKRRQLEGRFKEERVSRSRRQSVPSCDPEDQLTTTCRV